VIDSWFAADQDLSTFVRENWFFNSLLEDQVVSVTHTERRDDIRIMSIRKATKHEARYYFSQIFD
jgi:uncharacterized DUF497 family protein